MKVEKNEVTLVDIILDPEDLVCLANKQSLSKSIKLISDYSTEIKVKINVCLDAPEYSDN